MAINSVKNMMKESVRNTDKNGRNIMFPITDIIDNGRPQHINMGIDTKRSMICK